MSRRAAFSHTLASVYYIGVFYKLGDKERSKESSYVLVGFLARPFVSFVSHIARYAPSLTDKSSSLRNQKSTQPDSWNTSFFTKLLADSNKW